MGNSSHGQKHRGSRFHAGRAKAIKVGVRRASNNQSVRDYSPLEPRQVLAALFPTWINGAFTLGDPVAATPYNLADTFSLSTLPGANKTIYLDFNGHHSVNNDWGHDIQFDPYDRDGNPAVFSDAELIELQKLFQNVAEDFAPFDVNVTTIDPGLGALTKSGPTDVTWGIRVVHTQATPDFGGFGGVAFLNSFNDAIDNPCFAINKGVVNGAMTVSHEVGHTFGLRHDGLNSSAYHPGVGTGPTSWGPLMGAPFNKNLVHWSKGEYTGSTTSEDDLALITQAQHGVNFKPDDVGSTRITAKALNLLATTTAFDHGFIERPTDVDFYRLQVGTGRFSMDLRAFRENPNLDILATLYDSNGTVVATSNPEDDVNASFSIPSLPSGTYFVSVDGVGKSGVYTDYGSLGFYTIEATFVEYTVPPITIGESGVVGVNHVWNRVTLSRSYANPVVIAGPATRIGGDPVTIRVRNVTDNGFEIKLDEWDYQDGRHSIEQVSFLVVEAGVYQLPNGGTLQAGIDSTNHRWDRTLFSEQFAEIPVVFTQAMTDNDPAGIVTRQRSITTLGFEYRLQEEQAADRLHAMETVGWLAISHGSGVTVEKAFEVFDTGNVVTHLDHSVSFQTSYKDRPAFFAAMQSHYGGDPAGVRLRSIGEDSARFFLEEEQSFDAEMEHNSEVVGYFAIKRGLLQIPGDDGGGAMFLRASAPGAGDNGSLFIDVSTDDAVLEAALKTMQAWGETWLKLGDHAGDDGGCCCGNCLNMTASSIQTDPALSALLLGQNGSQQTSQKPTEIDLVVEISESPEASAISRLAGAATLNDADRPDRKVEAGSVNRADESMLTAVAKLAVKAEILVS